MKKNILVLSLILLFVGCSNGGLNPKRPVLTNIPINKEIKESVISIPVAVNTASIIDKADAEIPETLFQNEQSLANMVTLKTKVRKKDKIKLGIEDKKIYALLPLTIKSSAKLDIKQNVFGKEITLDTKELSTDFDFNLKLSSDIDIAPDRTIITKADVLIDYEKGKKFELFGKEIFLDDAIKQSTTGLREKLGKSIDDKIKQGFSFNDKINAILKSAEEPIKITNTPVPLYLYIMPKELYWGMPYTQNDKTYINLGARAQVKIDSKIEKNEIIPEKIAINKVDNIQNRLELNVPIVMEMKQLNAMLREQVVNQAFYVPEVSRSVLCKGIEVYGVGDTVVVDAKIESKETRGDIYLIGKIVYDKESGRLKIINTKLDVATNDLLANSAGWLISTFFIKDVEKALYVDIKDKVEKYKSEINGKEYPLGKNGEAVLRPFINRIEPDGIYMDKDNIRIDVVLIGEMKVDVK